MNKEKEMSFLGHLEIFRQHLIQAAIAILFFIRAAILFFHSAHNFFLGLRKTEPLLMVLF